MMTWRVIENNGGGLALEVYEDDELVYAHSGYEYVSQDPMHGLWQDVKALLDPDESDVKQWDGNEIDDEDNPYEPYPDGERGDNNGWRRVAHGDATTATIEPWGASVTAFFG